MLDEIISGCYRVYYNLPNQQNFKRLFLKISEYSRENNCVGVSFNLWKRDSNTGVSLWILQSF